MVETRTARIELLADCIVVARIGEQPQTLDDARDNLAACMRLAERLQAENRYAEALEFARMAERSAPRAMGLEALLVELDGGRFRDRRLRCNT